MSRAAASAATLLVAAWLALPATGMAATAGCPTAPALTATTYDAAVAELKAKRSPLVARRETVRSTRPLGTILEPPKPALEKGVCYLVFRVSDGSLARVAVKPGTAVVKPATGTADGPPASSPPPASTTVPRPGTAPPAATQPTTPPAATQPPAPPSGRTDSSRQELGKRIIDILTQGVPPQQQPEPQRPPTVDDVRTPSPPAAQRACPPLPSFSPQTVDAAIAALRQQRGVRPDLRYQASALPRGTLLAPLAQQRGADGVCNVTLVASDGTLVRVPRIVGMEREQAQSAVLDARLRFESTEAASSAAAPGSVLRQDPPAGTEVRQDTVVRTTVARSPDLVVPNVVGAQADSARQRLSAFRVEQSVVESLRPAGEIVRQEPRAGERRPPGTLVRVAASDGSLVEVPAITGLDENAARGRLDGLGLVFSSTKREDAAAPNTVVSQQPPAGAVVKRSSRVSAAVSEGLAVPRVIDLQLDAARGALARFEVETVATESEAARDRVLSQSPAPGTRAAAGARVRLGVSDASLVTVPDVVNRTLAEARAALGRAELVARVTQGADEPDSAVTTQAPPPATIVRRGSEVSMAVSAPFPWPLVIGAAVLLLAAAVVVYRWLRGRKAKATRKPSAPLPPMNVVASVEFQPAPPQSDDVERRSPDIGIDARLEVGETEIDFEERVHA